MSATRGRTDGEGAAGATVAQAILAAERKGVLPVTSGCPFACIFCSNRCNPPGLNVYHIGPRSLEEIQAHLDAMPEQERVVIGESATRVNEGEPFSHPQILSILEAVRRRFPGADIALTTGAPRLDRATVSRLAALAPLEVTVSLNSADPDVRRRVMGDHDPVGALNTVDLLAAAGLTLYGSAVALPFVTGWEDLYRTLAFLNERGFAWSRVFVPAYTRRTPEALRYPPGLPASLREFAVQVRPDFKMPLTVEPPRVTGLEGEIAGIRPGSPSDKAGLRRGDVVREIDGRQPFCRVEAHEWATEEANPAVTAGRRDGEEVTKVTLEKGRGERPGWVMDYDIDPERARRAAELLWHHRGRTTLVLTSGLAFPVVRIALDALEWGGLGRSGGATLEAVENHFFGGSIAAAGLLTIGDICDHLGWPLDDSGRPVNEPRRPPHEPWPEVLILPRDPFDPSGRDLRGVSWRDMAAALRVKVELV